MDNKTNQLLNNLKNIRQGFESTIAGIESFVKQVESGEGFDITDEQKKEIKAKLESEGIQNLLADLKNKKEQLFKTKI